MSLKEIIGATRGRLLSGTPNGVSGISIDSRTIGEDELFIAIKGANFDGHDFLGEALNCGMGALVSVPPAAPPRGKAIVYVKNTTKALQDIAHHLRCKRDIPVVGITGSNGKSTTKEMLASVLGARYKVLKNTGNLNNQIGLPLSLLDLSEHDDVAVLEMGASAPGDIEELCRIAAPDYGVLTNIGMAHIEGFKDMHSIRRTKLELLKFVRAVAVNADDEFLMEGIKDYSGEVVTYGLKSGCSVHVGDLELRKRESSFTLTAGGRSAPVTLGVTGTVNVLNALAAAAAATFFGLDATQIKEGLEGFQGIPMRLELRELDGATVISDVYNANPASMEEALKELIRLRGQRAVAVLGDMLELGSYARDAHRRLGSLMAKGPVDVLIAVGPLMEVAAEEFTRHKGKQSFRAADSCEAREILLKEYRAGDTILIKGSRGMRMECVMNGNGRCVG